MSFKKVAKLLSAVISTVLIVPVAACGNRTDGGGNYDEYSSVAGKPEDKAFSLESGLDSQSQIYPLSRGKNYYIAADGLSTNDGLSPDAPKQMSDIVSLSLKSGESVLLKKGDKFEGQLLLDRLAGADDNPITVASYGAETDTKPVIEYAGDVVVFNKSSNLVIRDLEISVKGIERTANLAGIRYGIIGNYDFVGSAKYKNIFIVNNTIYSGGTTKNVMGINISSVESTFANCPEEVLTDVYINNNTVHSVGRSGIRVHGWLTNEPVNQNNGLMTLFRRVHVDNNVIYDVGNIGAFIGCTTVSSINRNLVYNTGMYNKAEIAEGACGIMAISADTMDIMYNVSYNNLDSQLNYDAMAIDLDWNTTNINVQYNHTYDNMGGGIGSMATQNSFIRNNRIENNECVTNQTAQLQISDFTSRYAAVDESMHATKNVIIADNLIVGTPDGKTLFRAQKFNGDSDWSGNEFTGNRVIYDGQDPNAIHYVYVDTEVPWYKFGNNRYFAKDTSVFKCFDYTDFSNINHAEGAEPYSFTKDFSSWVKRDTGSTLSTLTALAPSKPAAPQVTFSDGKLNLTWSASKGDLYQYNIYSVGLDDELSYRNLLGQSKTAEYSYEPQAKGVIYIVIQPESATGVYGEALKLKVELK